MVIAMYIHMHGDMQPPSITLHTYIHDDSSTHILFLCMHFHMQCNITGLHFHISIYKNIHGNILIPICDLQVYSYTQQ